MPVPKMGADLKGRLEALVVATMDKKEFDERVLTDVVVDEVRLWMLDPRTVERAAQAYIKTTGHRWEDCSPFVQEHWLSAFAKVFTAVLEDKQKEPDVASG